MCDKQNIPLLTSNIGPPEIKRNVNKIVVLYILVFQKCFWILPEMLLECIDPKRVIIPPRRENQGLIVLIGMI